MYINRTKFRTFMTNRYMLWSLSVYNITRGSKEPVLLTLVYVNIKQKKQIDS